MTVSNLNCKTLIGQTLQHNVLDGVHKSIKSLSVDGVEVWKLGTFAVQREDIAFPEIEIVSTHESATDLSNVRSVRRVTMTIAVSGPFASGGH